MILLWIKKKIVWLLLVLGAISLPVVPAIRDALVGGPPAPPQYVTAPENNAFTIGIKNYESQYAEYIDEAGSLQYQDKQGYISFTPVEFGWKNRWISVGHIQKVIDSSKWENIFGEGIDIEMIEGQRTWRKVLKIDAPDLVPLIPDSIDYVSIRYEVDTDLVIDGWNKEDDFEITNTVRLGDFSYLEPARAWDEWSSTTCSMVQFDNYCDEGCTLEQEAQDLCEYCDPPQEVCETIDHRTQIRSYFSEDKGKLYYTKEIPVDWIKNAQFPIYTDADITYGTAVEFDSSDVIDAGGEAMFIDVAEINTNKFVVCWEDDGDNAGNCRVGTVSDTTITFGSGAEYNPEVDIGLAIGMCKVDTNKFAVIYADDLSQDDGYIRIASSTETTIEYGTAYEFYAADAEYFSCAYMAADEFVVGFNSEAVLDGIVKGCTVSGNTPTCGSPYTSINAEISYCDVCKSDEDSFIFAHEERSSNDIWIDSFTLAANNQTIASTGVAKELDDTDVTGISCDNLDDNEVIVVWSGGSNHQGQSVIATTTGDTINYGTITTFGDSTNGTQGSDVSMIDSTHFVITTENADNSEYGESYYSSYAAGGITQGSAESFSAAQTFDTSVDLISTNKIVICYADDADASDHGECIIGDIGGAAPPPAAEEPTIPGIIFFD